MGIDLLVGKLPEKWRNKINVFIYLLIACFGVFVLWQGYELASRSINQESSALGVSMLYVYMIIPVSGFLFFIFSLELIIKQLMGYRKKG